MQIITNSVQFFGCHPKEPKPFTEYNRKCNISTLSRVVGQYFKSKMKLHLSTVPVHLSKDNKLSKNTYKEENPDVSKVMHHT